MSETLKTYLGDGLYAEFDGYQFRLFTDRSGGYGTDIHEVYLDSEVMTGLFAFVHVATAEKKEDDNG
jgi:hypothetical protein